MKHRKRHLVVGVLLISLVLVVVLLPWKQKNKEVMKINGISVGQEEFELILKRESTRILRSYTTEEANQQDFWSKEIMPGKSPCTEALENTCSCLVKNYTLKKIAENQKMDMRNLDFDNIKEKFNTRESIYGPETMSLSAFYDYLYTDLEAKIREKLKQGQKPKQEELLDFYEQIKKENPDGEGMENFNTAQGMVKSMYLERKGNEQIKAAIADAEMEYDEEELKKAALDFLE